MLVRYRDSHLIAGLEKPLNVPLILRNRSSLYFPSLLGYLEDSLCRIIHFTCCELWCNNVDLFFIVHG